MMDFGSIADWVMIAGGFLVFSAGHLTAYVLLRSNVKTNTSEITVLKGKFDAIEKKEIALETLAACLDKCNTQDKEIEEIKAAMITKPIHDQMQFQCRLSIDSKIEAVAKDYRAMSQEIGDLKKSIFDQNKILTEVLVALGQLTTKIDERTKSGTILDRIGVVSGVNA